MAALPALPSAKTTQGVLEPADAPSVPRWVDSLAVEGAATLPMKRHLPDGGRKAWLPAERDRLFQAAAQREPIACAVVLWTYETASRITETLHARWEDIDLVGATVHVDRLKGSRSEIDLPLSSRLLELLKVVWGRRKRSGLLFPGGSHCIDRKVGYERTYQIAADRCPKGHLSSRWAHKLFSGLGTEVGLHPGLCHPHAAKHTRLYDLGEEMAASNVPQYEILNYLQKLSGHRSIVNLMGYLKSRAAVADMIAGLRRGLDRIHEQRSTVEPSVSDVWQPPPDHHRGDAAPSDSIPSRVRPTRLGKANR